MGPENNRGSWREGGKRRSWTFGHCTGNLEKKHRFPEANHCASRWKVRSYLVVHLPGLQQFSSGRFYFVGTDGEETLQLVVYNLWRKI